MKKENIKDKIINFLDYNDTKNKLITVSVVISDSKDYDTFVKQNSLYIEKYVGD
jgi:hypothetical protein